MNERAGGAPKFVGKMLRSPHQGDRLTDARLPQGESQHREGAEPKSVAELAELARQQARALSGCVDREESTDDTSHFDEDNRLLELDGYRIMDSGRGDPAFDRITRTACRLFRAKVSHIGIMDGSRLWYKSACGPYPVETPREDSLCSVQFTPERVKETSVMCYGDMERAMESASNPLPFRRAVSLGLRFYASAPLITPSGMKLGTLCIGDTKPRDELSEEEQDSLQTLAGVVMDLMEARKLAAHFQDVCESKEWQIRMSIGMTNESQGSVASSESSRMRAWATAREQEIEKARMQELRLHNEQSLVNPDA